jgi:hypothetical protein
MHPLNLGLGVRERHHLSLYLLNFLIIEVAEPVLVNIMCWQSLEARIRQSGSSMTPWPRAKHSNVQLWAIVFQNPRG